MARSSVWLAYAGSDNTTEENLIGIFTSRRKAKRDVLDYWGVERGKWDEPVETFESLDIDWLTKICEMDGPLGPYGYVKRKAVH